MRQEFLGALERARTMRELTADDLLLLIEADSEESLLLFALADHFRERYAGREVHLKEEGF